MKHVTRMLCLVLCISHLTHSVAAPPIITDGSPAPKPLIFYASASGSQTLDEGDGGGNPFASALIDLLQRRRLSLPEFSVALRGLTERKSHNFQTPEVPMETSSIHWRLSPAAPGERRVALVMGISDYSSGQGVLSLPGVANDLRRVSAALQRSGFETTLVSNPNRNELSRALSHFKESSKSADVAVIYTTGHGGEVDGRVKLLLGDISVRAGVAGLADHSVGLQTIASAAQAAKINLIFYGGCRSFLAGGPSSDRFEIH